MKWSKEFALKIPRQYFAVAMLLETKFGPFGPIQKTVMNLITAIITIIIWMNSIVAIMPIEAKKNTLGCTSSGDFAWSHKPWDYTWSSKWTINGKWYSGM